MISSLLAAAAFASAVSDHWCPRDAFPAPNSPSPESSQPEKNTRGKGQLGIPKASPPPTCRAGHVLPGR